MPNRKKKCFICIRSNPTPSAPWAWSPRTLTRLSWPRRSLLRRFVRQGNEQSHTPRCSHNVRMLQNRTVLLSGKLIRTENRYFSLKHKLFIYLYIYFVFCLFVCIQKTSKRLNRSGPVRVYGWPKFQKLVSNKIRLSLNFE